MQPFDPFLFDRASSLLSEAVLDFKVVLLALVFFGVVLFAFGLLRDVLLFVSSGSGNPAARRHAVLTDDGRPWHSHVPASAGPFVQNDSGDSDSCVSGSEEDPSVIPRPGFFRSCASGSDDDSDDDDNSSLIDLR